MRLLPRFRFQAGDWRLWIAAAAVLALDMTGHHVTVPGVSANELGAALLALCAGQHVNTSTPAA